MPRTAYTKLLCHYTEQKEMYAIPNLGQQCPVNFLKLFLAKTDLNATSLFNHCVKKCAVVT